MVTYQAGVVNGVPVVVDAANPTVAIANPSGTGIGTFGAFIAALTKFVSDLAGPYAVRIVHKDGSSTDYKPSADTDVARGTALLSAVAASIARDRIILAEAIFDIGVAVLNVPDDVSIRGAGMDSSGAPLSTFPTHGTIVKSAAILSVHGCILNPGNRSIIEDLTVTYTIAASDSAHYQAPFGCEHLNAGPAQHAFLDVIVRRCRFIADNDCLYIRWVPTNNTGYFSMRFEDCIFQSKYDTIKTHTGDSFLIEAFNTQILGNGPGIVTGLCLAENTAITMWGGKITANGGTACSAVKLNGSASGGTINSVRLFGVDIDGDDYDIDDQGQGVPTHVYGCKYDPAKIVEGAIVIDPSVNAFRATAGAIGALSKVIEVFDASGVSLGVMPIYAKG